MIHFLQDQPQLLEQFVQNYVSEETVETWLMNKRKNHSRVRNGDTYCKSYCSRLYLVATKLPPTEDVMSLF